MRRDFLTSLSCVLLTFALCSFALYVALQFSEWGQFNSAPPSQRPDLCVALASKHKLAILFRAFVFPIIGMAVGLVSSRFACRPAVVACAGLLPMELYNTVGTHFRAVPLSFALFDISIAVSTAIFLAHSRSKRPAFAGLRSSMIKS